jgi:hypothetical protein
MTIRALTRDAYLQHQQKIREQGLQFPLAASSLGMDDPLKARARRINTTDRAAIEALPTAVQETVWKGIKEFERQQKAATPAQSLIEAAIKNEEQMAAADAFCIAAFMGIYQGDDQIASGLVGTTAELAGSPDAWVVTDIAAEDRISFFYACLDADSASAKQLKMFRGPAPERVPAGPAGGLDTLTTIGVVESAG